MVHTGGVAQAAPKRMPDRSRRGLYEVGDRCGRMAMPGPWPRATLEILAIMLVVYAVQLIAGVTGRGVTLFALTTPLTHEPWTLVTSVYAHAGIAHLLVNGLTIFLVGPLIERRASRGRIHAFVLATGVLAGTAEVVIGDLVGPPPLVIGISGAVFGLMGYLLSGNRLTERMLGLVRISRRGQVVLIGVLAVVVTLGTGGPRVALIAHFTGFVLGILAGRGHLLRGE